MKQASRSGQGGPAQVKITEAIEDDLPGIVGILNYTAANSVSYFDTRPDGATGSASSLRPGLTGFW
jgi:hypothetical protein